MTHEVIVEKVVKELKPIDSVVRILFYGSASRGEENPKDVDVAVIVDDMWGRGPGMVDLGTSACPSDVYEIMKKMEAWTKNKHNVRLHIVTYWESEYEKGIVLDIGKKGLPDILNEVGITVYNFFVEEFKEDVDNFYI